MILLYVMTTLTKLSCVLVVPFSERNRSYWRLKEKILLIFLTIKGKKIKYKKPYYKNVIKKKLKKNRLFKNMTKILGLFFNHWEKIGMFQCKIPNSVRDYSPLHSLWPKSD